MTEESENGVTKLKPVRQDIARGRTVRQTIVETLEAPRLCGLETKDFVKFKSLREIYKRQVREKRAEEGSHTPLTSYTNSMEDSILELFITFQWVLENSVAEITEKSLELCVKEKACVNEENYNLVLIENSLKYIRNDKNVTSWEGQVLKLALQYQNLIKELGHGEFIKKRPNLAVKHIISGISHVNLRKWALMVYKLKEEEYKSNYGRFMRDLVKAAKLIDLHELSIIHDQDEKAGHFTSDDENSSDEEDPITEKTDKNSERSGSKLEKRKGPACLNRLFSGFHFIKDCPITSDELEKTLRDEYHEKKRKKESK